jgi:hypothetical protein
LPEASNFVRVSPVTGQETLIAVRNVNWKDHQTFPEEKADIILGSDLVYDMGILDMLIPAIQQMLSPSKSSNRHVSRFTLTGAALT